jgi:chromosome partitioning protein
MLTYTVYSEAGGVGKTTTAANLSQAHADHGHNVLGIDLDPQHGSLTYLLGIDTERDHDGDNLVRHLIGHPQGDFEDLVHSTEFGIDVIPSHNMLEDLQRLLREADERADEEFDRTDQLRQVLIENNVQDDYDVIVVDPPATAGYHLYNGVAATRSLVIPVEATAKGIESIRGLSNIVDGMESQLEINIGVLAVTPVGVGTTKDQTKYLGDLRDLGYNAPVAIRERSSLFDGCWDQQCTAQYYVNNHRTTKREHEMQTLDKIDQLATELEEVTHL